jgi:hypothetical protein
VKVNNLCPGALIMRRENTETKKEITIVGIVRELKHHPKPYRVGIAAGNDLYVVKPNEEEQNLLYEVGNKVEATGLFSKTKDIRRRIEITGYEVYEMSEDDPEEIDCGLKYNFKYE